MEESEKELRWMGEKLARMKNEKLLIYLKKIAMIFSLPTLRGSADV